MSEPCLFCDLPRQPADATVARRHRHITAREAVPIHPTDYEEIVANAAALGYSVPHYLGDLVHAALHLYLSHVVDLVTASER
jgi:hypothetical protein